MIRPVLESEWQRRRTALNHDWLKNRFLTALDAGENVLRGKIPNAAYFNYVMQNEIDDWAAYMPEIAWLIENFEAQMSPASLVDGSAAGAAEEDTRELCRDLVHQLWLSRYPVRVWLATAKDALAEGQMSYERLVKLRPAPADAEMRTAFSAFRRACHGVAKAIEAFPGRILTV